MTYRDEENQMKNEGARVVTTLYSFILDAQLCSWWMGVAENQIHSNFYGSPCYLQMRKSIQI